jgi:hypothetical protein
MANMLEGGGRTPLLSPAQLEGLGFKIAAYPLSLLGVSIRAMQSALASLKVLRHELCHPCIGLPFCVLPTLSGSHAGGQAACWRCAAQLQRHPGSSGLSRVLRRSGAV